MDFQILKPETASISREIWNTVKIRWQFWSIFAVAFISSITLWIIATFNMLGDWSPNPGAEVVFIPFFVVVIYIIAVGEKVRASFWKQFAEINGWRYHHSGDLNQEAGVMFQQGNNGTISHCIEGGVDKRLFRIFTYAFSIGSGKNKRAYHYTVFAFKFNGSFPHIYLNRRYNLYGVNVGEKVPLPAEFEKKFFLSAPKKYEIEALEIFTPDVLARLLDSEFAHDVELVDQEVLIFTAGRINNFEQLEKEFNRALELEDLLDEKLDKFKFQPIGDMPHSL